MQKVITGPPRAGKTYWAVRHILFEYFTWDDDLFKWVPKKGSTPFILTNIDGLRVDHVPLDLFLEQEGCTLPEFLTLNRILPFIEKNGIDKKRPLVILLDEAHGTFPYNFKDKGAGDPQSSTLYFFGYHGHYPIDIYLITHSWTDLCGSIAQRSEYQIDAERRTMAVANEFTYYYLHPKTQERLNKQVVKSDKRIHMTYLSSSGEHKTNEIRPVRKLAFLILGGICLALVSGYYLISRLTHPSKTASRPASAPAHGQAAGGAKAGAAKPPVADFGTGIERGRKLLGVQNPETVKNEYVQVACSGAWSGKKLLAVDLFGDVVPIRDLPYSYSVDLPGRRVFVQVPATQLAALRPGLWVDNSKIISQSGKTDAAQNQKVAEATQQGAAAGNALQSSSLKN